MKDWNFFRLITHKKFLWALIPLMMTELYFMRQPLPMQTLDSRFYYMPADVTLLLTFIERAGRLTYLRIELFDLSFLATYSLFILGFLSRIFYTNLKKPVPRNMILICLVPGFFDVIETVGIIVMICVYPNYPDFLPVVVSIATPLKWLGMVNIIIMGLRELVFRSGA